MAEATPNDTSESPANIFVPTYCRCCMQKFSSAKEVKVHKEAVHDQSSYPFSCPVCSKEFKQQAHRDSHVRTHTGDRPYECEHYWMAFKYLRHHILRRHCQNSDRPFSCDKYTNFNLRPRPTFISRDIEPVIFS